jgi:hypothetical protein
MRGTTVELKESTRINRCVLDTPEGAAFAPGRNWRYTLWRRWKWPDSGTIMSGIPARNDELNRMVAFIGLNPSTADEFKNDPTVTRCINFAKAWGYDGMIMLNLFAWRDTDPEKMKKATMPVGSRNDGVIQYLVQRVGKTIACWGNHGSYENRSCFVADLARSIPIDHLGLNKSGQPKHPLYIPASTKPELWTP